VKGIRFSVVVLLLTTTVWGQTREEFQRLFDDHYLPQVRALLDQGEYETVERAAREAFDRGSDVVAWRMLYLEAVRAQGRLPGVMDEVDEWAEAHSNDVRFLEFAASCHGELGEEAEQEAVLAQLNEAALEKPIAKRSAAELVALGRAAVALGAEPGQVFERFYERAREREPEWIGTYQAAGELALAKYDYSRAAREFREGLKQAPRDPELRFGLARALWPGDREGALEAAAKVLDVNGRHVGALLLRAESLLDGENYAEAEEVLNLVNAVFPNHPRAGAFLAAIAWLRDFDAEKRDAALAAALDYRPQNPEVPHRLGRSLSRKYRIEEGAAYQRQALAWDPEHVGAKLALTTDLLKQGREEEAWELAEEVAEADPYNVLAYNYGRLANQLETYETRETEHFVVKMREDEMAIYGGRVIELLNQARTVLNTKYGLNLKEKTLVEIFAEQQDFAIRTFGELGGAGYLGVCFGTVITMNSPNGAGVLSISNWEATLWHEYCHVVTLTATKNRMPRWLSEGISVYEERQHSPVWGLRMNRGFRARILGEVEEGTRGLVPIGDLSSAFLQVEDSQDLMFAYYQSSLVVEYLVDRYGVEAMHSILEELAAGKRINQALAGVVGDMEQLETEFAAFAQARARSYGESIDWEEPSPDEVDPLDVAAVEAYAAERPLNFWARKTLARAYLEQRDWRRAMAAARALIAMFPEYVESGNGYELLAEAARGAGDEAAERWAWSELARREDDAVPAYLRLMELGLRKEDWEDTWLNAERQLAVNPFVKRAHWCRGCAAEALGVDEKAAESYRKLLRLGPENPPEVRFRLARVLQDEDADRARREVVEALLEAPRFREAHRLLSDLVDPAGSAEQAAEKPEEAAGGESAGPGQSSQEKRIRKETP